MEKYLVEIKNVSVRQQVTKFRLSNHRLAIETGRHNKTPLEMRFCTFCPDKIEDETHFLFECSLLKTSFLRNCTKMYQSHFVKILKFFHTAYLESLYQSILEKHNFDTPVAMVTEQ